MLKRISVLLLSMSLISTQFVAVCAESLNETQLPPNTIQTEEYSTDRFIVETKTDTNVSAFSAEEATVTDEDIENAINDVISDAETISNETNVSDVALIEENSSVVTLSENVNADEFVQAVSETLGDNVIVQPDYPVYMDTVQSMSASSTSGNNSSTLSEWEENLAQAQELSTGAGARIAVLEGYYQAPSYRPQPDLSYIVDEYNVVGMSPYLSSGNISSTVSDIHSIAPNAQIMPIGVFGYDDYYVAGLKGVAYTSDIVKGIAYAKNKGAQVIVGDWRVSKYNAYLESKIEESGILFITSAADGLMNNPVDIDNPYPVPDKEYPACFDIDNVLTAGLLDQNYNKYYVTPYEDDIDIYAMDYNDNAASALAGAAALIIGKNNSADNLKDILINSAATVSYLPGTQNAETYKVLDFYDAVMGNTSSKNIQVTTARGDENIGYYDKYRWQPSIIYTDTEIEQIDGGMFAMAALTKDGKVILTTIATDYYDFASSDIEGTIYPTLERQGFPVEVSGLSNISQIAMTDDGRGLVALDENGDVYLYGNKQSLGLSSDTSDFFAAPVKCEGVENANNIESIYATYQRVWAQKKSEDNQHTETYAMGISEDDNITFSKIDAATDAKIYMQKDYYRANAKGNVYYIKDGSVYTETTSDENGVSYGEVANINGNITDIYPCGSGIYTLDSNGTITEPFSSSSTGAPKHIYNITQMKGAGNILLYRNTNDEFAKVNISNASSGSYIYDYITKISSDKNIKSMCVFGGYADRRPANSYYGTVFVLTEDGTLYYIPGGYGTPSGSEDAAKEIYMGIAAQSTFDAGNIHSVVPANINMEYGSATTDIASLLAEKTHNRATITLEDGTDISVPVQWNTSGYNPDKLGKQTLTGTLTLPKNITNPENLKAEANVTIKAPITGVQNFDLGEVDFDTQLSEIESQLANEVQVTLSNGDKSKVLPVVWDTSNYKSDEPGTYEIIGKLQIPDNLKGMISNPYNRRPVTTVTINPKPPTSIRDIINPNDIYVNYNTAISDIELPSMVTVILEDDTELDMEVVWTPKTEYNPVLVGEKQEFIGTPILIEGVGNPENKTASVNVIVMPEATGEIIDIEIVYLDADQGVPFEQIPDLPKEVKVTVKGNKTAMLPVTWENTYDEMLITTNRPQQIFGEVDLTNTLIENSAKIPAMAMISTHKANYVVKSLSPSSAELSVEFGTTLDTLLSEANAPKQVTVNLEKENDSSKTLSLNMNLEILSEDNEEYDAESVGLHNVIARPVLPSNIKIANDMYFILYVDVKEKHQVTKLPASPRLSTYRYTPANELDIPETITVQLDGDENNTVDIKVKWDMEEYYHSGTVGRDIILGEFIEIPNNINIPSRFVPSMSITVEDAEYEIVQFTGAGSEEMYAGYTIEEVAEKLSVNEAEAEIKKVDSDYVTHTNIPVIINYSEQNYNRTQDSTYVLEYTPDPPEGISNTNDAKYYFTLQTTMVDVDENELDAFPLMEVIRGTSYEDLNLPEKMPIKLVNGKTEMITMNWDSELYDPDSDGCIIPSDPEWLEYINHDGIDIMYNISIFDEEDVYTLTSISPSQLPATGAYDVKLGTSLEDIKNMLDIDEVEVTASKGSDERKEMVKFYILPEDNAEYLNASAAGTYQIKARLELPDDIHDTNEEQTMLIINVNAYTRTVKTISSVTKTGIPYGTPFNELGLPEQVKVTFTDGGEPEMINVNWDESTYSTSSTEKYQTVTGTLNKPVYVVIPNGKKPPTAIIYMKAATNAQLLSVTPKAETARFSLRSAFRLNRENELPDDVVEHKYIAEYLNEDGTITTEEFSTFEVIDVE